MKRKPFIYESTFGRSFLLLLIMGMLLVVGIPHAVPEEAGCCSEAVELADVPLELKSRAAPGLITLVLDNTRNMYYTIMTSEGNGTYWVGNKSYEILFPEHTFAGATVLPYEYRSHWKTQWSGFNTMYYNPDVTYVPWPRWNHLGVSGSPASEHADPDNPRKHPFDDKETLNLNETFYLLGEESGGGDDIIIDNVDPGFHAEGIWSNEPTGLVCVGEGSHYTNDVSASAIWKASNLTKNKNYDIYVHIPYWDTPDSVQDQKTAKYSVIGNKTVIVTRYQPDYPGWTLLAENIKSSNTDEITVKIEVANSSETGYIDADAVSFFPAGTVFEPGEEPSGAINIVYAHYYVQNENGKFLINMNGALAYYRFDDKNNNDVVDKDELSTMTQEEASEVGIITNRNYIQERQNFANWYQFYRKRAYTGIGAVGQFIDDLSGVYFRLYGFPPAGFKFKLEPIRVTVDGNYYDATETVLRNLYDLKSPQAVSNQSLRTALYDTGELIESGQSNGTGKASDMDPYSSDATYPFFTEQYGGTCQQAFAILMTGGYWTTKAENINLGDVDKDGHSNTLADVAMHFYERDLKNNLANNVPTNYMDNADWQHLVTYGISFGVESSIDPQNYANCHLGGNCPDWPPIEGETNTTIDDLWHATVNGRGLFINAANPEELVRALKAIRSDIEIRLGSAAAVSTNSVQRQTGTHLYQGTYHSGFWAGDLLAKPIDVSTGAVLTAVWSAQEKLEEKGWEDRKIFTFDGTNGIEFVYDSLAEDHKNKLDSDGLGNVSDKVDYLRGNRDLELKNGGPFRNRDCKLGDIVHSEPVYHNGVVYIGANDGMLHAFDADNGDELFAYIPNLVFGHLFELTRTVYEHRYYVNNTPFAKTISIINPDTYQLTSLSLLVGGLSKGGKGYFCLDITNPGSFDSNDVLWEYTATNDDDLGYSYSRAYIVNTKAAGWVVVFGNGYNSANGEAVLYVLNATTGSVIKKIHTGVFGCNGIVANPSIIDPNFDGKADYVYVGDLKGNMWKFDISGDSINDWGTAYISGSDPKPLFTAKNANGNYQPITSAADIMHHCTLGDRGYLVIFGTGQYVNEADFDTTDTQTLYGITDRQPALQYLGVSTIDKYLGEFTAGGETRQLSNIDGFTLLEQSGSLITYNGINYFVMSNNTINYWNMLGGGSHLGWYFDLPQVGERIIRDPMIRNGVLVAIGSTPVQTPCSSGGTSMLYQISACSGGATVKPQFDIDDSGKVDSGDVIIGDNGEIIIPSGIIIDSMLYKPVDIKDRLYISDDSANINEIVVPSALGGMLYWRETDIRP
jgi:type IV pilus assembly protein PilY1